MGDTQVLPLLALTGAFDDNIFKTSAGTVDDFITVFTPRLQIDSNLAAHEWGFIADGDFAFYADNSSENYQDARVAIDGRYDFSRKGFIHGGAGFRRGHEDRGSPDDSVGTDPGIFYVTSLNIGESYQVDNRVHYTMDGDFDWLDYDDVTTTAGIINNDDRDRFVAEGELRMGYFLEPGTRREVFARGRLGIRSYSSALDDAGFDRDSIGYEVVGGYAFDLTDLGFPVLEVYAGWIVRDYDAAALSSVSGPTFGATAIYAPSPTTTVRASAARLVQETTLAGASGILQTVAEASIDQLLRRNLSLNGRLRYINNDYEGIARDDDIFSVSAGARWYIGRHVDLELTYTFTSRSSDAALGDYDRNHFLFGLRMKW